MRNDEEERNREMIGRTPGNRAYNHLSPGMLWRKLEFLIFPSMKQKAVFLTPLPRIAITPLFPRVFGTELTGITGIKVELWSRTSRNTTIFRPNFQKVKKVVIIDRFHQE